MAIRRPRFFAAAVVMTLPEFRIIEIKRSSAPAAWPYVPGLLSFREAPAILEAFSKLKNRPNAVIFDGQGIAHPQRFGLAAHLGLWLELPSIGCAKSCLVGDFRVPEKEKGSFEYLYDKEETIGAAVRTRNEVKPVFISPGHLADLPSAIKLALQCTTKYRLPEPIRKAHREAEKEKQKFLSEKESQTSQET